MCLSDKSENKKNKDQWLNIVLAVVISAFITFMITSTYGKNKLAEAEESRDSQGKHIISALEDDFDPDSENVKMLWTSFKTHETNIAKYTSDPHSDVGLKMIDNSHDMEEGASYVYVESKATFKNVSDVPVSVERFEVNYQWDDEPAVSFQALAYHDEFADIEIDIEGAEEVIYPGEEFSLRYDAEIEKNIAGEYGLSLYKFMYDFYYDINYVIHSDDIQALNDE